MLRPQNLLYLIIVLLLFVAVVPKRSAPAYDPAVCAGPPLRTLQERNDAMETGYQINPRYDCIERASFDAINAERIAWEQQHAQQLSKERQQLAKAGEPAFAQARHGFATAISGHDDAPLPLPEPPTALFVRSDYKNPQNYTLPGYISPNPGDGRRHPAIIWLTGGDSNSLSDFWTPGPDSDDQSARAFRDAGVIMVYPTLRGGNGGRAAKEWFLGEVDDVLAAAEQLKQIGYVDADRIYLGGHSTGGTLALLTAAMRTPFKAVFAFGPVASADRYADGLIPVDFAKFDPLELKLRSPIHWLGEIAQPTYLIEGADEPANGADFDTLCGASRNPQLHCLRVAGSNHMSVLRPATLGLAARLASGQLDGLTAADLAP